MSTSAPHRLNGAKLTRDKTGLVTLVEPWEVYSYSDCAMWLPASIPLGLLYSDRDADESEVGTWLLRLKYEGYVGPQQDGEVEIELDTSMAQDPIQSHPYFSTLKKKYGWNDETKEFAQTIADPKAKATGLAGKSSGTVANPLYGVESYLAVGAIFRATVTLKVPPGDLLEGVGTIVSAPPYWEKLGVPKPKGRDWLKLAPKANIRGNATRISYEHELSGPSGWLADVYSAAQLTAK